MYSKIIPALAALGAGVVSAQSSSNICSSATLTITDAAMATNIPCGTINGAVKIAEDITGNVDINGPRTIKGDLIVTNVTQLVGLSSSTLASVEGTFKMQGLTVLSNLQFTSLTTVGSIDWVTLPALGSLVFGTAGVTKVNDILISDTFLKSLDGLNVASVDSLRINNNNQLVSYSNQLANATKTIEINSNGPDLGITLPNLIWAGEIIIADAAKVQMDSLEVVNGSIKFDKNTFTEFIAPNLTETSDGDVSFINNVELTNLSLPLLTKTGGGLTIQNNTLLQKIDGLPELKQIGGAVLLRGNFTEVALPALEDVKGAFDTQSTGNIDTSCDIFNKMDGRQIQGDYKCRSNNTKANEDGDSNGGSAGGSQNGSGSGSEGAAGIVSVNTALLGAALLFGFAKLL
ncbi:Gpi-anchored cell wall organization protein [Colletotrichum higginsianum IMI 349063]|uniref:Gpi-anchored cell wall organization protein n=3 Tax=Colletotrichum destructivum species complex TaxID=2707350 RepID=A0A1B7Y5B1_COLHI|nr:Gpi-anchored cell wall organization protein [Colletotrichum higginsianum IMI 349063]OBR07182.1 Gpi-anchored cell wall organization protein [Colletotrichum higginsianum IMI 349063]TIC92840.1 Protein ecm33 [Colletotrichum higginsianum]WQF88364.1 Putative Receptor L-domain superfamily [Colletotrichum destructivum]GJC98692.1 GPI-anchored cell wall organization protein [Colletotrichum higginsianum]